jgi:uncharacterized protein YciI
MITQTAGAENRQPFEPCSVELHMKMNYLLLTLVMAVFAVSAALGQAAPKPKNPNFDASLAKKLGADERGMKNYVLVILKAGPNYSKLAGKERDEVFKGHFANINRLAKEGSLLVAGPFGDQEGDWAGLFVFNVDTVEAAQKLTETDPTLKAGVFIGEYHKWYGSAAMMEISRIHNTLTP